MKRIALFVLAGTMALGAAGCSTKTYVRKETAPTIDKVNELDELTAKNTKGIRDADTRALQGIQQVNTKAATAEEKATAAAQAADQANQTATRASGRVTSLTNTVVNLDNYRSMVEASVHFGFNKSVLTAKAREALDQLGSEMQGAQHYIVVVDGNTDSVGPADYNYQLSQHRADAVIQYLATKYELPAYKIYVIGLGKDKPAAANATAQGRAENRRVDVHLMTNREGEATSAKAQAPAGR